jgi:hypothetical protein
VLFEQFLELFTWPSPSYIINCNTILLSRVAFTLSKHKSSHSRPWLPIQLKSGSRKPFCDDFPWSKIWSILWREITVKRYHTRFGLSWSSNKLQQSTLSPARPPPPAPGRAPCKWWTQQPRHKSNKRSNQREEKQQPQPNPYSGLHSSDSPPSNGRALVMILHKRWR